MRKLLSLSVILATAIFCCSWGYLVHRTINQLAIYQLPGSMRPFFYTHEDSLAANAPRPDMRRGSDPGEGSKHFIDLEAFGDSAAWKMPSKWEDAVRIYGKDSLLKYGYIPYHVIDIKNKLTGAFRAGNKDSILFYATDLGHYIGDAHVPLHTTINYDGQFSGQRGIHDLWETSVPESALENYKLHNRHKAVYLAHPEESIWQTIREAHSLLNQMLEVEIEVSKGFNDSTKYFQQYRWGKMRRFYSPAFSKAYNERLGQSINQQLLFSANQIADFWYTAWVDAGSPELSGLMAQSFDKTKRRSLKKECRAYRRNQLIKKKLLIARDNLPD
jgi:hypothetical protein